MPPLFWPPFHATTCRLGPVVCDFYTVIISRVAHAVRPHSSGLRRDLWPCVRYIWGCRGIARLKRPHWEGGRWTMDDGRWTMDDGRYIPSSMVHRLWSIVRKKLPALIEGHPMRLVRAGVLGARADQPV